MIEAADEKAALGAMPRAAAAAVTLLPLQTLCPRTRSPHRMVNILWLCGWSVRCGLIEDGAHTRRRK